MSQLAQGAGAITCRHLLVPVDETIESTATVVGAVELARIAAASITFMHVPRLFPGGDTVAPGLFPTAPLHLADGRSEVLAKAESVARAQGVPCASAATASQVAHAAILAAADQAGCDLIVLGTCTHRATPGTPDSPVAAVLAQTRRPVLVLPVAPPVAARRTLGIIRHEHRIIATVLRAWHEWLTEAGSRGVAADVPLMRIMVRFIEMSLDAQRHARKEKLLFSRLRRRTCTVAAELEEQRHRCECHGQRVGALGDAVERYAAGAALAELTQAVDHYAQFVWNHHGREEGVILAAAQRYLSDEDWSHIDAAFCASPVDARTREEQDRVLGSLLARITSHRIDGR
jgi:hemerythrin-like domain-containing protein/nucleotide-binding universal stress UspA family protein